MIKCESLYAECNTPPTFIVEYGRAKRVCRNHLPAMVRFGLKWGPVTVYSIKQWNTKKENEQNGI